MEKKVYRNRLRVILAEKEMTNMFQVEQFSVSKMTLSRGAVQNLTQYLSIHRDFEILNCKLEKFFEPFA